MSDYTAIVKQSGDCGRWIEELPAYLQSARVKSCRTLRHASDPCFQSAEARSSAARNSRRAHRRMKRRDVVVGSVAPSGKRLNLGQLQVLTSDVLTCSPPQLPDAGARRSMLSLLAARCHRLPRKHNA